MRSRSDGGGLSPARGPGSALQRTPRLWAFPLPCPPAGFGARRANVSVVKLDLTTFVAAVDAEGRDIDLSGVVLHPGCQNVVLETRDGWILRFPREPRDFEREVATLSRLAGRLPVSVPQVEWTGQHTSFAAYRKLHGQSFDPGAYQRASPVQREVLAGSLADFLVAMHQCLTSDEIDDLQIPDHEPGGEESMRTLDMLPPDLRRYAGELIDEADELRSARRRTSKPTVVLHNDLHFHNMVLSAPVGEVTGVWDFSSVAMGDPSDDLRCIPAGSCDLMHRVARGYELRTGDRIDLRAAILANRIEVIFDAVEDDRTAELRDSIRSWRDPHPAG
jgi:Phosphotransferase enzyme family